ncbi:helix-turn-helix transcriptional regulator [Nonomuraea wenchangensis]
MNGSDEHAPGTLLRRWRERALLTQEQLAEKAGLSVRTIRRLELGDPHRPRTASLRLLSEALGLNAAERALLTAAHTVRSPSPAPRHPPAATPDPCNHRPPTAPPHTAPPLAGLPLAVLPFPRPPFFPGPPLAALPLAALPLAVRGAAARLRSAWSADHVRSGGHGRCPGPFGRSPGNSAP